ncbi:MAG: BatD family protein [Acidobacteria bacterium]|nr:BatD family protein [Acidobacteriota bacterium]
MRNALLLWIAGFSFAQVKFVVKPRALAENEILVMSVVVENPGTGETLEWPDGISGGDGFEFIRNATSNQTSMSLVNGRMTYVQTVSYQFRPKRQGDLVFPAQRAILGRKEFRSEPVTVKVGPPNTAVNPRSNDPFGQTDPFDDVFTGRRQTSQPEVLVKVDIKKRRYFVGEAIPFVTNLYTHGVYVRSDRSSMDLPTFDGFWMEELDRQGLEASQERLDGKVFDVYPVDARVLYANKPGTVQIPPVKFTLVVTTGGFFSRDQRIFRETEPVELEIVPHPDGAPDDFDGVVGKFKLTAEVDRDQVKVGESISVKLSLTGKGNFSAIAEFPLQGLDPNLEFFAGGSPQTEIRQGLVTGKVWTHALVPKAVGDYEIPVLSFSFLNPETGSYERTEAGPFTIKVLPGDKNVLVGGPQTQARIEISDENMRFIKLEQGKQVARNALPNPMVLLKVAGLFGALDILLLLVMGIRNRWLTQKHGQRPKYAFKQFKRKLSQLKSRAGKVEGDVFHTELSSAVLQYFGDKWERSATGVSMELVREQFGRMNLDDRLSHEVEKVIEECDLARFTPSSSSSREQLLMKASEAIGAVEEAWP